MEESTEAPQRGGEGHGRTGPRKGGVAFFLFEGLEEDLSGGTILNHPRL